MRPFKIIATALLTLPVAASAAETIAYKYDVRGRLVEVCRSCTPNSGVKIAYSHDRANNRTSKSTSGASGPQSSTANIGIEAPPQTEPEFGTEAAPAPARERGPFISPTN